MSHTNAVSREFLAIDLVTRMKRDGAHGSIGAWITVDGQDVWVQATHELYIESQLFHDDTPAKEAQQKDENQLEIDLDDKRLEVSDSVVYPKGVRPLEQGESDA